MELEKNVVRKIKNLISQGRNGEPFTYQIENWPDSQARKEKKQVELLMNVESIIRPGGDPLIRQIGNTLEFKLMPTRKFDRYYNKECLEEDELELEVKHTQKAKIHIDKKGLSRTHEGKILRYKISKNRLAYVLNVADGRPITYGIPPGDISNLPRDVQEINRLTREKLLLSNDILDWSPNTNYDLNEDYFDFTFGDLSPKRYLKDIRK